MARLTINKFADNLPVTSIVGLSQAALGFGLGLLFGNLIARPVRDKLAVGGMVGGASVLILLAAALVMAIQNRPSSVSRMRRRLESIRRDTGLSSLNGPT